MATAEAEQQHIKIKWKKQPRQVRFVEACGLVYAIHGQGKPKAPEARVILYGGAAGGGKSDALLIVGIIACYTFPGCNVGYFRREFPQLEGPGGAIMRSREQLTGLARYNGTFRRWTFPNGSVLQFCHAKNESDVYGYQSQQFDFVLIDESTQFTKFQLRYLLTRNRATVKGVIPLMAKGTNPGNYSHGYHREQFVDVGPPEVPVDVEVEPGRFEKHLFIPSFLQDNVVLEERDPGYRTTLENQPEEVRRALLEGDWSVFAGQFFKTFRKYLHTCEPFAIPQSWTKFVMMDWGFAAPCAVLWGAVDPAYNRVFIYREVYVTEMRPDEVASLILDLSQEEDVAYFTASPDIWQERGLGNKDLGGESIGEVFDDAGVHFDRADNRRVMGWSRVRDFLTTGPDGHPFLMIFNTCVNLIRTLPELIHDEKKVEDVDDKCEDHAPEALRYGLMSRPSPVDAEGIYLGGEPGEGKPRYSFDQEEHRDEWEDEDIDQDQGFY